jgi:hypothetical protein
MTAMMAHLDRVLKNGTGSHPEIASGPRINAGPASKDDCIMEEKEQFFMSIEDAYLDEMAAGHHDEADYEIDYEIDFGGFDEDPMGEDADDPHPERFYLACQKALVRLKQHAATSPSF